MDTNTSLHEGYKSNLEFMTKIFGKNIQALNLYIYQFSMGFIIITIKINGKIRRFDRASVIIK